MNNPTINREGDILLDILKPTTQVEEAEFTELFHLTYSMVVARYQGIYLLVFNRFRQRWEVPGGRIEVSQDTSGHFVHEDPANCALRELLEESGQAGENLKFEGVMKLWSKLTDRIKYGALYSVELNKLLPFQPNEEISKIALWDSVSEIGYIDEIDKALLFRVSSK